MAHRASSGEIKVIKPSNPFTNVCLAFVECFLRHKLRLYRQFSSLPNSRNEEMMGDGFFGATAAGLF